VSEIKKGANHIGKPVGPQHKDVGKDQAFTRASNFPAKALTPERGNCPQCETLSPLFADWHTRVTLLDRAGKSR
jgi:hypothetical protein